MNQTFCSCFLYKCVSMKEILAWGHCSYYFYSEAIGVLQQIHATSWVSCAEVLGYFFSCRVLLQECAWIWKFTSRSVTSAYGSSFARMRWSAGVLFSLYRPLLPALLLNWWAWHFHIPQNNVDVGSRCMPNLLTFPLAGVAPWVKDCFLCIVEICFIHISHQICA